MPAAGRPEGIDFVQHYAMRPRVTGVPDAEPEGFAPFYAVQFPRIATPIYAYLGDHAEAQDIAQAFLRALSRWKSVGAYEDPVAWVRHVAWNLATSRLRRVQVAMRDLARQREEHAAGPTPDRVALIHALATLAPTHRLAVVLHHLGNLTTAEIAEQQGVAEGTVRSWLSRGRARLAAYFEEKTGVPNDVQTVR
jgi:RNA polymerase sigma-70 factor (ECF subfamily)